MIAEKQVGMARSWIYFKDGAKKPADGLDVKTDRKRDVQDAPWSLAGLRNWKDRIAIYQDGKSAERAGLKDCSGHAAMIVLLLGIQVKMQGSQLDIQGWNSKERS